MYLSAVLHKDVHLTLFDICPDSGPNILYQGPGDDY